MSILRVQDMTPQIYTEESRDFQLLSRLYDSVFNGLKFDVDSISSLINTKECRTNILQLLQTKLGFFTERKIDDEKLRSILECFPIIVRNKGSLRAVKQVLYLFLRMYSVSSDMEIYYLPTPSSPPFSEQEPCVLANGKPPENDSLVMRIHSFQSRPDTTVIEELFRYILPSGTNYYIEFDKLTKLPDIVLKSEDAAELTFISANLGSNVRGSDQSSANKLGAANTASVISSDNYVSSRFIGYYADEASATAYLATLTNKLWSTAIINYTVSGKVEARPMICTSYSSGTPSWLKINFLGHLTTEEAPSLNDIVNVLSAKGIVVTSGDLVKYNNTYLLRNGSSWSPCAYAQYILNTYQLTE